MYVVVTGPPASGKSTLTAALAVELGLPLLAEDTLEQGLVDGLGAPDVGTSRRLGRAAVALPPVAHEARCGVGRGRVWCVVRGGHRGDEDV